jgi:hypothetical protein
MNQSEQSTELSLIDGAMPKDISAETRTFINAVAVVKDLEQRLPLIETIEEVENLRSQTIAVARWAEEKQKIDSTVKEWKELYQWAVRVSMMCQRRVGQILKTLDLSKGGRPQKTPPRRGGVLETPPPPTLKDLGLSYNYASDAKTLAGIPEEKLGQKIEAQIAEDGQIKKQRLIKQIRAEAKRKGETIDEKTAKDRARWRINAEKKQSRINQERAKTPRPRESPSDKFRLYWTKEKTLLRQFFAISDLEKVGEYWWREFHAYRSEAEKILSDLRQDRERRKALTELAKP